MSDNHSSKGEGGREGSLIKGVCQGPMTIVMKQVSLMVELQGLRWGRGRGC